MPDIRCQYSSSLPTLTNLAMSVAQCDASGRLRVVVEGAAAAGPTTPATSMSVVAAQSTVLCTWQVAVTSSIAPLVPAWVISTAYKIGQVVTNDTGKMYRCITAGTSAGSGGPTGVTADITDNTVHWAYVSGFANGFRVTNSDPSTLMYLCPSSAGTTGTGEIIPGNTQAPYPYAIPSAFYLIGAGSLTASVSAAL